MARTKEPKSQLLWRKLKHTAELNPHIKGFCKVGCAIIAVQSDQYELQGIGLHDKTTELGTRARRSVHWSSCKCISTRASATTAIINPGTDIFFRGLQDVNGFISVAGFGSLLSRKSAVSTFPELQNFRTGIVKGYRRIFAHTASIFSQRGIARSDTREISSLSCEPHPAEEIVVSVFEIPGNAAAIQVCSRDISVGLVPSLELA